MPKDEDSNEPSSPACLMHEFADELVPPPPPASSAWPDIKNWRARQRERLIARRLAEAPAARRARGEEAKRRLSPVLDLRPGAVLGIYWPIRGEIDVRDVAQRHIEAGGIAALPVVTEKHAPVEFWRWEQGAKMQRGFWNIPVPADREAVRPDVLLIPLVGFDRGGFRLGYGGGYYDRTLAALTPPPFRVGIGYADAELATIYPQPHDVPMSLVVTDASVHDSAA